MAASQAFWLAASGEAETTPNLPPSAPRMFRAMSAMVLPISLKSTWATKTCSPSAEGMGESQVTTVTPLSRAALAAGAIWSPALLESMTALTPCVVALVMISIWPATLFSGVGPRNSSFSGLPSSLAASWAPWWASSKGRMPRNLGSSTIFAAWPGLASITPAAAGAAVGLGASVGATVGLGASVGAVVGAGVAARPHAASSSNATTSRFTSTIKDFFICSSLGK